jgi:hypothetical protein
LSCRNGICFLQRITRNALHAQQKTLNQKTGYPLICASDFKGRRKAGGGYAYYDSCQHRTFDIKGPNPTPDEVHYVKLQCLNYLDAEARAAAEEAEAERKAQQAAQEAREMRQQAEREARVEATRRLRDRKIWAIRDIHVTPAFDCRGSLTFCSKKFKVTNGSNEALSGVLIGLAFAPTTNAACPSTYAEQHMLQVKVSPGETRDGRVLGTVDETLTRLRACIKVLDVQFAGD